MSKIVVVIVWQESSNARLPRQVTVYVREELKDALF